MFYYLLTQKIVYGLVYISQQLQLSFYRKTAMQAVLERFSESIPKTTFCTDDFCLGSYKKYKDEALKRKYIQPQIRSRLMSWLIFDIDRAGAAIAHEDADLPIPTIITVNPVNAHAHILYQLAAPVAMTAKSSTSAILYVESIERAYKAKLGADLGYAGLLTKNPLHESWRVSVNDIVYDLSELAEYVDLCKYREAKKVASTETGGRNDSLFNAVRKSIYKIASNYKTEESLFNETLAQCYEFNITFTTKLQEAELRSTAKSIAKYAFKNRHYLIISKEAINTIEIAAISIAHDLKLDLSILQVCKLQQKETAKRSGLSVDTIQRYMSNCAA